MSNTIVTLCRNNLSLTKRAVASFLAQDIGDVGVLLINNASTDGTAAWAATLPESVQCVHHQEQESVAHLWNKALYWIFCEGHDHALVVNNDVILRMDTYRLLLADGGQFVTAVGVNEPGQMETCDPTSHRPHPDFSCFLIRRECWERFGDFDESYLIAFGEDCDAHVRLHRLGIEACCIDVPFYHVGSATVKNADREEVKRIQKQADLNRERFFHKYGARIGTPEYETLFSKETFGIDKR